MLSVSIKHLLAPSPWLIYAPSLDTLVYVLLFVLVDFRIYFLILIITAIKQVTTQFKMARNLAKDVAMQWTIREENWKYLIFFYFNCSIHWKTPLNTSSYFFLVLSPKKICSGQVQLQVCKLWSRCKGESRIYLLFIYCSFLQTAAMNRVENQKKMDQQLVFCISFEYIENETIFRRRQWIEDCFKILQRLDPLRQSGNPRLETPQLT